MEIVRLLFRILNLLKGVAKESGRRMKKIEKLQVIKKAFFILTHEMNEEIILILLIPIRGD